LYTTFKQLKIQYFWGYIYLYIFHSSLGTINLIDLSQTDITIEQPGNDGAISA
jgi:hypothetical protein